MVGGLILLAVAVGFRAVADEDTALVMVAVLMAASAVAGAIVQTSLTTVMMTSAPPHFGGVVSAVRSNVQSTGYAFGSALLPLLGVGLFPLMGGRTLAGEGVSAEQARNSLRLSHLHGGSHGISSVNPDPQSNERVISAASSIWVEVGTALNLTMSAVLLAAAGVPFTRLRRISHPGVTSRGP